MVGTCTAADEERWKAASRVSSFLKVEAQAALK
jgi:hypothetical protein